jgi:predicted double-glycine peptidase
MSTSYDTNFANVPENKAAMAVMGIEGDTKYIWDPDSPEEVEAAREHFNAMRAKGFMVFKLRAWVKTKEVQTFNPRDKRYAYVPPKKTKAKASAPQAQLAMEFDPEADRYVAVLPVGGG